MTSHSISSQPSLTHSILAGLTAGGVAAIAASVASLALRSPDPTLINSATVALAVLIGGTLAGVVLSPAGARPNATRHFLIGISVAFAAIVVAAALVEAAPGHPLTHVLTFCVPLAALSLALLAVLTPAFARLFTHSSLLAVWIAPIAAVVAVGCGLALAGRARTQTGSLGLPDAPSGLSATAKSGLLSPADVASRAFAIDPSQSKASYTVREQLVNLALPDNAVGTTSDVSGTIFLDGRPSTVSVGLRTFTSDDRGRDSHLLRDPGLANFAPAQFTTTSLDLPGTYKPGDTVTRQVQGTMKINNVERPMTFAVEGRLQDNTLFLHGQADFTWKDFDIRPPTFSAVLQVADTIHAEILLVAKAQS
ncbi:MAG TPA: YceI family protein [Dehalococcoidia bacterium]|nr:YceI family protein [Dehalococcoidia bacterium]